MASNREEQGSGRRIEPPLEMRLTRRHRLRLVAEGSLVGLVTGGLIASYRFCLSHAEEALRIITGQLAKMGLQPLWFLVLAAIMLVVGRLMLFEPHTQGSGIPQLDAEIAGKLNMNARRVLPVKFIEGVLCAFAGLSLGREGPSLLLSAQAAKAVARKTGKGNARERMLETCGAAAGMAAAFHAPLTGILFAIEEIHKEFSAPLIISVMASSVVSDFVSSGILGYRPQIHFITFSEIPLRLYAAVLLIGIVCGILGTLHNAGAFFIQGLFDRIEGLLPYSRLVIPFALAGICAFAAPDLMCGGDAILESLIGHDSPGLMLLLSLLVGKYLFTCICFGSGAPGGTLFPLVVMGMLIGAAFGVSLASVTGISGAYVSEFCALGITGLFAATIQAPVTAVVLVFELTASFNALLAASVVSIIAYVTSTLLGTEPYYEHLLARLLGATDDVSARAAREGEKILQSYTVGVGSVVEGRRVAEIVWPKSVLVVTLTRAGDEVVVHGDTTLSALDELVVVMGAADESRADEELHQLLMARPYDRDRRGRREA